MFTYKNIFSYCFTILSSWLTWYVYFYFSVLLNVTYSSNEFIVIPFLFFSTPYFFFFFLLISLFTYVEFKTKLVRSSKPGTLCAHVRVRARVCWGARQGGKYVDACKKEGERRALSWNGAASALPNKRSWEFRSWRMLERAPFFEIALCAEISPAWRDLSNVFTGSCFAFSYTISLSTFPTHKASFQLYTMF